MVIWCSQYFTYEIPIIRASAVTAVTTVTMVTEARHRNSVKSPSVAALDSGGEQLK